MAMLFGIFLPTCSSSPLETLVSGFQRSKLGYSFAHEPYKPGGQRRHAAARGGAAAKRPEGGRRGSERRARPGVGLRLP